MTFLDMQTRVNAGLLRADLVASVPGFINEAIREIENRHSFACMKDVTYRTIYPGVQGAGGNVVPLGAVWPAVTGSQLSIQITGLPIGSRYFYVQGNGTALSLDGTTPLATPEGFFTATATTYYVLGANAVTGQLVTSGVIDAGLDQVAVMPTNFKELQRRQPVSFVSDDGSFVPAEVVYEHQEIFRVWAFGGCPIITWPPRLYMDKRSDKQMVLGLLNPIDRQFNIRAKYFKYLPDLVADGDTSPFIDAYPEMVLDKAKAVAFSDINDESTALFEGAFERKLLDAIRRDAYSEVVGRDLHL